MSRRRVMGRSGIKGDLSYMDIYGNITKKQNTANCYIINKPGVYAFPLVYGNAIKDGEINSASYTNIWGSSCSNFVNHNGTVINTPYIENYDIVTSAQLSIADEDGVFGNIKILNASPCRYIQFEILSVPTVGANGVISIKNSAGTIMWSWHIWVWSDDLTPIHGIANYDTNYYMMPYSLGSKWTGTDKSITVNWYYQWGRPTPLLCRASMDSYDDHVSFGTLNLVTSSSSAENIQMAIQNPTTVYGETSWDEYGWIIENKGKTFNLWDASMGPSSSNSTNPIKTVYDPSPVGFRVPHIKHFNLSFVSYSNYKTTAQYYTGSGHINREFPLTGQRSYRGLSGSTKFNMWMSESKSNDLSYYVQVDTERVGSGVSSGQSEALSVMPIQE